MKTIARFTAVGLVLVSAAVAAAESGASKRPAADPQQRQQRVEQMKARWSEADANHDGGLSRDEAKRSAPKLAEHFDKLDADGDGKLTPEELRAAHQARKDQRSAR